MPNLDPTTQPALRRLPRPTQIQHCRQCDQAVGTNYATCPTCNHAIERHWLADWQATLNSENILPNTEEENLFAQVIFDEGERHLWSVLDIAMTLLKCPNCHKELGGGPTDCTECASAWGVTLWAETLAGRNGLVTGNEHSLHVGRMVLRHPHRQSNNTIAAWSRTMPRLLTGWLPSTQTAQHYMAKIKAGKTDEVDAELAKIDQQINQSATKP